MSSRRKPLARCALNCSVTAWNRSANSTRARSGRLRRSCVQRFCPWRNGLCRRRKGRIRTTLPGRRHRSLDSRVSRGPARCLSCQKVPCGRSCSWMSRKLCVRLRRSISRPPRKITSVTGAPTPRRPLTSFGPKRNLRLRWRKLHKFTSNSSAWGSVRRRSLNFPRDPARAFTAMSWPAWET